jgi:hypothetical protein
MEKTWAEFSTLHVDVLAYAVQLNLNQKQPNLKSKKTQPKQMFFSR